MSAARCNPRFIGPLFFLCGWLLYPALALADRLETVRGEFFHGRLVKIENGIAIFLRGESILHLPVADISSLTTDEPLELSIADRERFRGALLVRQGQWSLQSAYGDIALSLPEIEKSRLTRSGKNDRLPLAVSALRSAVGRGDAGSDKTPSASGKVDKGTPTTQQSEDASPVKSVNDPSQELSFLRNEAVLLTDRKVAADFSVGYLRNERLIQSDRGLIFNVGVRANVRSGVEAFAVVPLIAGERISYLGNEVVSRRSGIGDVRFGIKSRLLAQSASVPETVLGVTVHAPTGEAPYVFLPPPPGPVIVPNLSLNPNGGPIDPRNPLAYQLGSGHWATTVGLTAFRTYDPIILFGGIDYTRVFAATYFGTRIKPGDRYGISLGTGFAVSERSTLSQQIFMQREDPWKLDGRTIPRTYAYPVALRLAYTHRLESGAVIEPSIQFGLTSDTNNALFSFAYSKKY